MLGRYLRIGIDAIAFQNQNNETSNIKWFALNGPHLQIDSQIVSKIAEYANVRGLLFGS